MPYGGGSKMKKRRAIKVLGVFLLITGIALFNFRWWPSPLIEKTLFMIMPIGTSMDKAIRIIESNDWEIFSIGNGDYRIKAGWPSYSVVAPVYSKTIETALHYSFGREFIWTNVYFGFDDDENLVGITVYKSWL
jgi:hypothetical protein